MEQEHSKMGRLFKSNIQLPPPSEAFDSAIPIWEMLGITMEEYNERYPSIVIISDSESETEPEVVLEVIPEVEHEVEHEVEPEVEHEVEPEVEPEKVMKKVKRTYVRRKNPETK